MHFHTIVNTPGYLPDNEPDTYETFEDAKAGMISDLLFDADHADNEELAEELDSQAQDLNLDSGPEWGSIIGNFAYEIRQCNEEECEEELGR